MKIIKVSILVFIVVFFTSCSCIQHVQGIVIDAETQLPIDSVKVELSKYPNMFVLTDSLGKFEYVTRAAFVDCTHRISLSFEKEGYNKETNEYKSCCTYDAVVILKKHCR